MHKPFFRLGLAGTNVDADAGRDAASWQSLIEQKKGLQLALEPLNGRGIAGYVPKP